MERGPEVPGVLLGPLLGSGAAGVVYEGTDRASGTPVAVKVVAARSSTVTDRALQEAELSWSLNHAHVVRVLRWGRLADGSVFLVMERLDGESLSERLRRVRTLEVPEILEVGRQLARALAAVHARGALHRDVKPSNVFLGRDGVVRLLDLGLARIAEGDPSRRVQTVQGTMLGTPGYLAPEQLLGDAVDARTDLFGLGATLYRAFSGEFAFGPGDRLAVVHKVAEATHPPPIPPGLPLPLAGLLSAMLHPDIARRPDGAETVRATLDALAGDESTPFEGTTLRGADIDGDAALEPPDPDDEDAQLRFRQRVVSKVAQSFPPGHLPSVVRELLDLVDAQTAELADLERQVQVAESEVRVLTGAVDARERMLGEEQEQHEASTRGDQNAVMRRKLELRNGEERLETFDARYAVAYADRDVQTMRAVHIERGQQLRHNAAALTRLAAARLHAAETATGEVELARLRTEVGVEREGRLGELESRADTLEAERMHVARGLTQTYVELALVLQPGLHGG